MAFPITEKTPYSAECCKSCCCFPHFFHSSGYIAKSLTTPLMHFCGPACAVYLAVPSGLALHSIRLPSVHHAASLATDTSRRQTTGFKHDMAKRGSSIGGNSTSDLAHLLIFHVPTFRESCFSFGPLFLICSLCTVLCSRYRSCRIIPSQRYKGETHAYSS